MHPVILRFDSLPSTNTEASRQARQGAPEGLCVIAREQTKGRGRAGRTWISPPDAGLYFSLILRPKTLNASAWPLITLMAALAVRDALLDVCQVESDIKWPNDILVNDRKLSGILAETIETVSGRAVILGIGINLDDRAFPPELNDVATSVLALSGSLPDTERLTQTLVRTIDLRYEALQAVGGEGQTIHEWMLHSSYAQGRHVRVTLTEETFDGWTRGLEPDGALRVETHEGEIRTVRAGDVTSLRVTSDK